MKISIKRVQNDARISSAEREKFGTKFNETFRFLSMAALLVVGAIMTGCSSDDNIDNPQQPANSDNVVTLTATVGFEANAGTRAIDPSDGTKTFEAGKQIAVFYEDEGGKLQKTVSTDFTPTGDKTKATFTVTLTNAERSGKIRYIYPASMAKDLDATPPAYPAAAAIDDATIDYTGLLGSQDGTLATLANYDLAVKDATLSGTDQPASVTLTNPLAICALKLTDGTNTITSSVNSLTISDGTNTYIVTPSELSTIYVAVKPASNYISFVANTASKTYVKTVTGQTLEASKLYTSITVSMVDKSTLIVSPSVGQIIGDDGKNYANETAATAAGATAVAKIVYVGSDNGEAAPYNHGLALALSDVSSSTYTWCSQTTATCLGHQYDTSTKFNDLAGIANTDALVSHTDHTHAAASAARNYNSGFHPTGTSAWFLPSAGQWDKMATAAGGYGTLKTNAGLLSHNYWSSSERNANVAWSFYSGNGDWNFDDKAYGYLVRACLAF